MENLQRSQSVGRGMRIEDGEWRIEDGEWRIENGELRVK
jgi:hypothetical protein